MMGRYPKITHTFTNHILELEGIVSHFMFSLPQNSFLFKINFFIWQVSFFDKRNEINIALDEPVDNDLINIINIVFFNTTIIYMANSVLSTEFG